MSDFSAKKVYVTCSGGERELEARTARGCPKASCGETVHHALQREREKKREIEGSEMGKGGEGNEKANERKPGKTRMRNKALR